MVNSNWPFPSYQIAEYLHTNECAFTELELNDRSFYCINYDGFPASFMPMTT